MLTVLNILNNSQYLLLLLFWWSTFIPSRNLDEVFFTFNQMALMPLRSRSHVKASVDLTGADHFYTQLYKITSKYYSPI